jgi:hypothetical protein
MTLNKGTLARKLEDLGGCVGVGDLYRQSIKLVVVEEPWEFRNRSSDKPQRCIQPVQPGEHVIGRYIIGRHGHKLSAAVEADLDVHCSFLLSEQAGNALYPINYYTYPVLY